MFLNHILSALGFILLFVQPLIGVALLVLTGIVYFLHDKIEDATYKKRRKKYTAEENQRREQERKREELNKFTADIERLEKEYFDNPDWAFETRLKENYFLNSTGEPFLIRGSKEYKEACRKTNQTPVFELVEDWEKFEKKINKKAQRKKERESQEADQHEDALWEIVQKEVGKNNGKDDTQASIYQSYYSLEIPKGRLTARKMRGHWKIRVVSEENPHLNLEWDVSI